MVSVLQSRVRPGASKSGPNFGKFVEKVRFIASSVAHTQSRGLNALQADDPHVSSPLSVELCRCIGVVGVGHMKKYEFGQKGTFSQKSKHKSTKPGRKPNVDAQHSRPVSPWKV